MRKSISISILNWILIKNQTCNDEINIWSLTSNDSDEALNPKLKSIKYLIRLNWSLMWQMFQSWCSKRAAVVYITALFSVSLLHGEKTEGNYRQYGLPDLLKGLFLGTCGLAGSHLLSMSFLSWPQTAIKKRKKERKKRSWPNSSACHALQEGGRISSSFDGQELGSVPNLILCWSLYSGKKLDSIDVNRMSVKYKTRRETWCESLNKSIYFCRSLSIINTDKSNTWLPYILNHYNHLLWASQ